ncbi:MAG: acyl-CoA dehydrogenase family protein, partial [Myxococcota bacterium]
VETDGLEGFQRGRNLEKIGMKGADTSELHFEDCKVPVENLLGGQEGQGFFQLMMQLPYERLAIAVGALGAIDCALELTLAYTREREAFGRPISRFQNTRFKLAEAKTKAEVLRSFVADLIGRLDEGKLDATTASMAKWWGTDIQGEVTDECLQLFGGYGYMLEYPIAHLYADARAQRIYGGTNEIMKELIARSLNL